MYVRGIQQTNWQKFYYISLEYNKFFVVCAWVLVDFFALLLLCYDVSCSILPRCRIIVTISCKKMSAKEFSTISIAWDVLIFVLLHHSCWLEFISFVCFLYFHGRRGIGNSAFILGFVVGLPLHSLNFCFILISHPAPTLNPCRKHVSVVCCYMHSLSTTFFSLASVQFFLLLFLIYSSKLSIHPTQNECSHLGFWHLLSLFTAMQFVSHKRKILCTSFYSFQLNCWDLVRNSLLPHSIPLLVRRKLRNEEQKDCPDMCSVCVWCEW